MKKLMTIIAFVAISMSSFGQIAIYPVKKDIVKQINGKDTIVSVTDSTTLTIGVYAGMFSGVEVPVDRIKTSGYGNVLTGAYMNYNLTKWFSINSWAGIQLNSDGTTLHAERFWFKFQPIKQLSIELGSMASIPTEQRPLWITGPGQFETTSSTQVVGGGIGAKVKYQINNNWGIAAGVVERNKQPEYSARFNYKKIMTLSGWYTKWDNSFGSALSLNFKPLSTILQTWDMTYSPISLSELNLVFSNSLMVGG
ncbi:MAG: hypothetical protein NT085_03345 [candidate division SR1 bacterium]|nr:hypothetical protein [candidate division SR1 bacterium]